MLDSLFEQLDKSVFTPELISKLEEKFNAEVAVQAKALAADKVTVLEDASEQYKHYLDKACQDYLSEYKRELGEKVDLYLTKIAKDFVDENQQSLNEVARAARGNTMFALFERITDICGKDLSKMVTGKEIAESSEVNRLKANIDRLEEELLHTKAERYEASKAAHLLAASEGKTLPQKQRLNTIFELSEANITLADKANINEREIQKRVDDALEILDQNTRASCITEGKDRDDFITVASLNESASGKLSNISRRHVTTKAPWVHLDHLV